MRGQTWVEFILVLAIIALAVVAITANIFLPFANAVAASMGYVAASAEIVRQESIHLQDYRISSFQTDPNFTQITVSGMYASSVALQTAVQEVVSNMSNVVVVVN